MDIDLDGDRLLDGGDIIIALSDLSDPNYSNFIDNNLIYVDSIETAARMQNGMYVSQKNLTLVDQKIFRIDSS